MLLGFGGAVVGGVLVVLAILYIAMAMGLLKLQKLGRASC